MIRGLWDHRSLEAGVELDHVIVFVAGPGAVAALFPGFVLDAGVRHVGQGTRNRRVVFTRNYIEMVWIEDAAEERRSGLGFGPRCAPAAACPFGVVLRGPVEENRDLYRSYRVPGGGPALLLLESTLRDGAQPFVAVHESGEVRAWPEIPRHPGGARAVRRAVFHSPTVPDLGGATPDDVGFECGPAGLRLEWDGAAPPWSATSCR
jgi:hypothetical protein